MHQEPAVPGQLATRSPVERLLAFQAARRRELVPRALPVTSTPQRAGLQQGLLNGHRSRAAAWGGGRQGRKCLGLDSMTLSPLQARDSSAVVLC